MVLGQPRKSQCEKVDEIASMAAKLSNGLCEQGARAHRRGYASKARRGGAEKLAKIEESIRNLG